VIEEEPRAVVVDPDAARFLAVDDDDLAQLLGKVFAESPA